MTPALEGAAGCRVGFEISDFGFELQESCTFEISDSRRFPNSWVHWSCSQYREWTNRSPIRPRQLCRRLSRSSGVMFIQRSDIRSLDLRECLLPPPPRPKPPNRIRQSTSSPSACQKVTCRNPNSAGASQFHNDITIQPPIVMKDGKPDRRSHKHPFRYSHFHSLTLS